MSVGEVCKREVVFISKDSTVVEAAKLMREHHVGALVVTGFEEGRPRPIGVLTDRDIVVEVIAADLNGENLLIADVMSFELATIGEDDGISEAIKIMKGRGVRRVPVINSGGDLVGIFTVDDVIDLLAEELSDLAKLVGHEQEREKRMRK